MVTRKIVSMRKKKARLMTIALTLVGLLSSFIIVITTIIIVRDNGLHEGASLAALFTCVSAIISGITSIAHLFSRPIR